MSKHDTLLKLIPQGRDNAISMNALASLLRISPRDLRRSILDARLDGVIIAGTDDGYFIPIDEWETLDYYLYARQRALTSLKSLTPVRRVLKKSGVLDDSREAQ